MQKKQRIVHLTSSLALGGAEAVLFSIVKDLHEHGYDNYIVSFRDGPYKKKYEAYGIPVFICAGNILRYTPLCIVRLTLFIKKIGPVCIHATLWAANLIGRLVGWWCGIACVNVLHNRSECEGVVRYCADRVTMFFPATRVAVSDDIARDFACRYPGVHKPCIVIKNGLDYTLPVYKASADKKKSKKDSFVFGTVGRFFPVKNYSLLIRSFAALDYQKAAASLVLIGYGPEEEKLRALVREHALESVVSFFIGASAHDYYHLFDCFVQPSLSEGLSIALLEAMGHGVMPLVSCPTANHPVITHNYDGVLMPVNDYDACRDAMKSCMENRETVAARGQNARQTVHRFFSSTLMHRSYRSLFEEVTKN